jgi:hypothetical protein
MRLTSIINVWADCIELLPFCIKNHLQFCDGVIVVWSQYSNHGAKSDAILEYILANRKDFHVEYVQIEPVTGTPLMNETRKRNYGIDVAKKSGFTHFLIADADEFYEPEMMNMEKDRFKNPSLNGLVHPLKVYIKTPTLFTFDHTFVCGIHKLNSDTVCGNFKTYPFAYDNQGQAHIDPSRRLSYTTGIELSYNYMHHFSYVRKNIDLKIDNSSANLRRSRQVIYDDLRDAKPGYVSKLYHQPLKESENYFNIVI